MIEVLESRYGLFMTVEDLAEVVKSNKQTIYNRLYDESLGIPHWRMGKRYLFPTEGVADYISAQLET
jgi:excisionase family DNA binding protein